MVSEELRRRVKLSVHRAYKLAQQAGMHPSTLSKILNGIERVEPGDPRVTAIGRVVGLNEDECFAKEGECATPNEPEQEGGTS